MTIMRKRARQALGILALGSVVWAGAGCGTEKMNGLGGSAGTGGAGTGGASAAAGHAGSAGGASSGAGGSAVDPSVSGLQFNGSISFFRVRP